MYKNLLSIVTALALLVGCSTEKHGSVTRRAIDDYFMGQYASARAALRPVAAKTDEDYVLNNVRLGSASLVDHDLNEAESAFFRAYEVINSTGVNDAGRASAAVLLDEKLKVWKGEPFERAMTNFYLGLVYYARQDYANARAAFENALFKLRDYGEGDAKNDRYQELESDFLVAYLMLGKAHAKLGNVDKARDMFDRVARLRSDLRPLAERAAAGTSNVLLVVDHGLGPRKVWNYDNSIVTFRPTPAEAGPIPLPIVRVDGRTLALHGINLPPVDLLALAQERRWQSIDTIRLAKSAVGTGMMAVGGYQAAKKDPDYGTAAALIIGGALLKASATGDVRHWEMLPRTTFVLPLRITPGRHDLTVTFPDGATETIQGLVAPPEGQEATYYLRPSRLNRVVAWPPPNYDGPFAAPPSAAATADTPSAPARPRPRRAQTAQETMLER